MPDNKLKNQPYNPMEKMTYNERLRKLNEQRRKKQRQLSETSSTSWQKRLRRMELDLINKRIEIEKLKQAWDK